MRNINNENIIEYFNARDKDAFDAVYELYFANIAYFSYKIVKDEDIAKDTTQEIFINLWNNTNKFENFVHLKAYLYKSVYNKSINYIKKETTRNKIIDDICINQEYEVFDTYEMETDIIEQIYIAIEELPEKCRRIFRMSYLDNLDVKTISEKLGIASSTVMMQRQRAKKYISKKFKNNKMILLILFIS